MSVLTGIPPQYLLDLDPLLWEEMVEAMNERWSVSDEMGAQTVEMVHGLYSTTLAVAGVKDLPDPYRVPRPGDPGEAEAARPRPVSFGEFAAAYGRGHMVGEAE